MNLAQQLSELRLSGTTEVTLRIVGETIDERNGEAAPIVIANGHRWEVHGNEFRKERPR